MTTELVQPEKLERANTVANLVEEFLRTAFIGCSTTTVEKVSRSLNSWLVFMHGRKLTPKSLGDFILHHQARGIKGNTVNDYAFDLRRFFRWCFRQGYTKDRWYEFVPSVRGSAAPEPKIITHTEYLRLLECAPDRDIKWGIVCGYHTGLRLGDVCSLLWSDINMESQFINTYPAKTRRLHGIKVEVPIITNSDIHVWLLDLMAERNDVSRLVPEKDFVCENLYLRHMQRQCVAQCYRRVFWKAGISDRSFKHFRSTFESRMANSGMNIGIAAKITGRTNPKSLMRYIKVDPSVAHESVAKALELHHKYEMFR